MKKIIFSGLILGLFCGNLSFAQSHQTSVADSINKEFNTLINASNNFQNYKVIETVKIQNLRKDIEQEIASLETEIGNLQEQIEAQQTNLAEIQANLNESEHNLEAANQEKDQLKLLGISTQKSTYHSLMIVLISGLFVSLLFFIYRFKNALQITTEAKELLNKNEKEFDAYKKQALLTQQKLGRQIVDQRKKFAHLTEKI